MPDKLIADPRVRFILGYDNCPNLAHDSLGRPDQAIADFTRAIRLGVEAVHESRSRNMANQVEFVFAINPMPRIKHLRPPEAGMPTGTIR